MNRSEMIGKLQTVLKSAPLEFDNLGTEAEISPKGYHAFANVRVVARKQGFYRAYPVDLQGVNHEAVDTTDANELAALLVNWLVAKENA